MQGSVSDAFRISVSSAPSTSSQGSGPDDCDSLGDVYIWGEVICDNYIKNGADKNSNFVSTRTDVLLPKLLESNVVLDVHHISCGVKHAALVTRQGEVFTWGEESGGRLGHGVRKDVTQPLFVESLAGCNVDFVACGEFHTCAITISGELYTWGDGTHYAGLLGKGTDVSHWIPRRISGILDGLQVSSVTCGPWHTALLTSTGQLFTFGDGTFGVLGHGSRENVLFPREVDSLKCLRTISVACGVWHTAAVVEVLPMNSTASISVGKLFTWGDGDKNRLGHGDKEARLKPTCVSSLIDHNFYKVTCGHSLTVGLTTLGRVLTMGSAAYGQLGNFRSNGNLPCVVGDTLKGEFVEDIFCGAYHVSVLTARHEVYTWGKGANGRLGHGDTIDRKTPSLVEALMDKHVKYIACGSNYTAAICLHKCVSGAEQFQCSACKHGFGFTRKRHNCYNCGIVHCHSCSSNKALRAALAPDPNKPYRVCDSCYAKLNKLSKSSVDKWNTLNRLSGENKDRLGRGDFRISNPISNLDLIKHLDSKAAMQGKNADTFLMANSHGAIPKPRSRSNSRPVSPFSKWSSPPRSVTPQYTTSGMSFSKSITDSLKKTNDLLNREVIKLHAQVDGLKHRCQLQESEIQNATNKTQEALALVVDESAKSKASKEFIKSLTAQLKDMAEKLPSGFYDGDNLKPVYLPNELEPSGLKLNGTRIPPVNSYLRSSSISGSVFSTITDAGNSFKDLPGMNEAYPDSRWSNGIGGFLASSSSFSDSVDGRVSSETLQDGKNGSKSYNYGLVANSNNQVDAEWIEQHEHGVYITLIAFKDGTREIKRVRFSRRRFMENQAQIWWSENREKIYQRYNILVSDKSCPAPNSHISDGVNSLTSHP